MKRFAKNLTKNLTMKKLWMKKQGSPFLLFLFVLWAVGFHKARAETLDLDSPNYKTPLSGQGFDFFLLGDKITVLPRDRRKVTAWDLGAALIFPGAAQSSFLPVATLFFWRRPPSEDWLFRAVLVGLYNEILVAKTINHSSGLELVGGFENLTIPFVQSYYVQGQRMNEEELISGWARASLGLGFREQLTAFKNGGENDNMFEWNLLFEPGYSYFQKGAASASDFHLPPPHFEVRGHSRLRYDALKRNLLELPHEGFAFGADVVQGYRTKWRSWGRQGNENTLGKDRPGSAASYFLRAGPVPGIKSDRHRLLTSFHGGAAWDADRFSRFSLGGGPTGEEYYSIARPTLPGAFIYEFLTSRYAVAIAEYRWEPLFFIYLSARGSLSLVDRERLLNDGARRRQDDWFASGGARLTSGFVFNTRLQIDYNYNSSILRFEEKSGQFDFGGHELMAHVSGEF